MARERIDQDFIREKDLLEALGLDLQVLERLIYKKGFPHIKIAKGIRVYYEPSVIEWLKANEFKKATAESTDSETPEEL